MSIEIADNSLSREGYRWMELIQANKPIEGIETAQYLPRYAEQVERAMSYDKTLRVHHVKIWWPVRELVCLRGKGAGALDGRTVLLWRADKRIPLSESAVYAGIAYADLTGRWPAWIGYRSWPENAPAEMTIYADQDGAEHARLVSLAWLPTYTLAAGEGAHE